MSKAVKISKLKPKSKKRLKVKGILQKVDTETLDKNLTVISNVLHITPKKAKAIASSLTHIIKKT